MFLLWKMKKTMMMMTEWHTVALHRWVWTVCGSTWAWLFSGVCEKTKKLGITNGPYGTVWIIDSADIIMTEQLSMIYGEGHCDITTLRNRIESSMLRQEFYPKKV